jgi:thiamine biosynthesis lipoprotein
VSESASFAALGTTAVVAVSEPGALAAARALLAEQLDALEQACSRFRDDSELATVNACAGDRVHISELLAENLAVALEAARTTDGIVDPTLGSELRSAGYDRTFALVRVRDRWALQPLARRTASWHEIELDTEACTLRVPRGIELDLGATAKALAADRAAVTIATETGAGVLVSLGGDIAVAGPPPPEGWSVRIADDHAAPLDARGPSVSISGGGLATSSTLGRSWQTNHGSAHHIIDPRTRRPAVTPWSTVTVAAATCADANVAATAAIVLADEAAGWLAERHLPARLVRGGGTVTRTANWPAEELTA